MKKLLVLMLLAILAVPASYGLTASIGNAKVILRVEGSPENPAIIDRTMLVNNKNDVPVSVKLSIPKQFEKFVDIIDEEFTLEPGESKKAAFVLTIDRGGEFKINLLATFSPLDEESKESPVGLSSTITIFSDGPIIEDPAEETPQEEVVEETAEVEEDVAVEEETEGTAEEESGAIGEATEEAEEIPVAEAKSDGPNPFIGALIIAVIVGIGLGIIYLVLKFLKK